MYSVARCVSWCMERTITILFIHIPKLLCIYMSACCILTIVSTDILGAIPQPTCILHVQAASSAFRHIMCLSVM